MEILTPAPGSPEFEVTCTPASFPSKDSKTEPDLDFMSSAELMDDNEPVKSFRFATPYPITTISLN